MKILYVILTCEKNKERQRWQRETWLKDVHDFDFIYLDDMPDGIEDNYQNAPFKYLEFIKHFDSWEKKFKTEYDWFFFCDDDTFVYTDRLEWRIERTYPNINMIGFSGGIFPIYNLNIQWCSGGAGIALRSEIVKNIQTHLRNTPRPLVTHETDISLAIWATMANKDLVIEHNKSFSPFNPRDAEIEKLHDCITYHYCNQENFYSLYAKK